MTRLALLLFQLAATSGPALPDPSPAPPASGRDCQPDSKEIVVCARDKDAYRLPQVAPTPEQPMLPKAEWRLFGDVTMDVHAAQRSVGGWSKPAAMATVKIPF